jgi:solute carrier family 35 protein
MTAMKAGSKPLAAKDIEAGVDSSQQDEKGHANGNRDKIFSALFYALTSLAVIFTNKSVMTEYHFPYFDFLAFFQFLVTTCILWTLRMTKRLDIPPLSFAIVKEVMPISVMFLGNVICGLGGTRSLSLPMFTALRRLSILMTMLAEYFVLNTKASCGVVTSVLMMVGGAYFAALYDLRFDAIGYLLVTLNNIFTALNGVYMKKASISGRCNKIGILYYNSLFSAIVMLSFFSLEHWYAMMHNSSIHTVVLESDLYVSTIEKVSKHPGWGRSEFIVLFVLASMMGSVLNYSIFLCTTLNSALTTAVIGCLKNVATTYIGMIVFSDYTFQIMNFIGLNISIAGSLYYTYVTIFKGDKGFGGG